MEPPCYNRPPRSRNCLVNNGIDSEGKQRTKLIPAAFVDRCATWDGKGIGPNNEPYPVAHGWDCRGCRWLPKQFSLEEVAAAFEVPVELVR